MSFPGRILPICFFAALAPAAALADTGVQLEKSATYAFGSEVHAFRVPTTDSAGKITYNDVVIKLNVGANGSIATSAAVTATASPNPPTTVNIVPGTYKASDGTTCTITNFTLTNARVQSNVLCVTPNRYGNAYNWDFSVVTGTVTSGHPFLTDLVAVAIDKRSDVNTQIWGLVTGGISGSSIGQCSTFYTKNIIGAKTNGNQIIISLFNPTHPASYSCSGTLVKQ